MFKASNTREAQIAKLQKLMRWHRDGYSDKTLRARLGMGASEGVKAAARLNIAWTGRPLRQHKKKEVRDDG